MVNERVTNKRHKEKIDYKKANVLELKFSLGRNQSLGHKIVDCPERKPQEPQEKSGYRGKREEYKDTQPRKTMGRVFQLTAENA
ncbi:hypothetical protein Tco_0984766 [Tanacetum coccineum]